MKTLIVYEKSTGNVFFAQTLYGTNANIDLEFIIADIPENRTIARVENGEAVLEDAPEVKAAKERLAEIEKEELEIKMNLLELEEL